MSRQWWIVAGVVVMLCGLIALGWMVRERFLPLDVGDPAPDFAAVDLTGRPVRLSDLRGEVVLVNIWATWCAPCRDEMPSMQRLYERLRPQGLRIVAVSVDAVPGQLDAGGNLGGDIAAFAREMGLTFDIWWDASGRIQQTFRTTGVPESFVVDRTGLIVAKRIGGVEWDAPHFVDLFQRLLQE